MTATPPLTPPQVPPHEEAEDARAARQMRRAALDFGTVGIQFGIGAAIGYYLGAWLDDLWGTGPWLALSLALCGIASAFKELIRLTRRAAKQANAQERHP